ncbi:NADH-quinone oxidoreductase subunit J [Parvibium lacunae]|uniref:NADH-quinone oxidoreductase subunit J n=1 Tax=Parvibium lacunae TaxID=1888893 RepID=A0A368L529_9BURK|nr:NADH-quinone oxidoreductase subunit J [Parvibium lacunae]RCS58677.1 NADH-quinone oxidoreductase subunit J [Parvibium lacunae]
MNFTAVLFYVFAGILILAGLRVITARNPVHAALFLVLSFASAAALWMLLRAEFLAIALILVYVGAVMVLFLFVVMMLDINIDKLRQGFWTHLPVAAIVGVTIVLEMAMVIFHTFRADRLPAANTVKDVSSIKGFAEQIFVQHVLAFEIAAVILVVALVAAVALTLRGRKDAKRQIPGLQVKVKAADRVRLVSMPAVKDIPAAIDATPNANSANPTANPK